MSLKPHEVITLAQSVKNSTKQALLTSFCKLKHKYRVQLFSFFLSSLTRMANPRNSRTIHHKKLELFQNLKKIVPSCYTRAFKPLNKAILSVALSFLDVKDKHAIMLTCFNFYDGLYFLKFQQHRVFL